MKRTVWFITGAAAGASSAVYAKRKVVAVIDTVRPSNVAHTAADAARRVTRRVAEAVQEGVDASRRKERELLAERDGRLVRLSDYLTEHDEVVIDGQRVDSARVTVLRQRNQR